MLNGIVMKAQIKLFRYPELNSISVSQTVPIPRSWVWFPGNAWPDQTFTLNAMHSALDKSICQMQSVHFKSLFQFHLSFCGVLIISN